MLIHRPKDAATTLGIDGRSYEIPVNQDVGRSRTIVSQTRLRAARVVFHVRSERFCTATPGDSATPHRARNGPAINRGGCGTGNPTRVIHSTTVVSVAGVSTSAAPNTLSIRYSLNTRSRCLGRPHCANSSSSPTTSNHTRVTLK